MRKDSRPNGSSCGGADVCCGRYSFSNWTGPSETAADDLESLNPTPAIK